MSEVARLLGRVVFRSCFRPEECRLCRQRFLSRANVARCKLKYIDLWNTAVRLSWKARITLADDGSIPEGIAQPFSFAQVRENICDPCTGSIKMASLKS